jgi:hypothetical protein
MGFGLREVRMARFKRKVQRKFRVRAKLDNFELAKARCALRLEIYGLGEKVGELQVGRGSIYWWGAHRQREKRISWARFAEMMDKLAYGGSQ